MRRCISTVVSCLAILCLAQSIPAAETKYLLAPVSPMNTSYPMTPGPQAWTLGINDIGQVASYRFGTMNGGNLESFVFTDSFPAPIPPLPTGTSSKAMAINNASVVVGEGNDQGATVGVFWQSGMPTSLGELPGGTVYSSAVAINNRIPPQVVGTSNSTIGTEIVRWEGIPPVSMTPLGKCPGGSNYCYPRDINDEGTIVGWSFDATWNRVPFKLDSGGSFTTLPKLFGTTSCQVFAINNSGIAVGNCGTQAVLWNSDNTVVQLPPPIGASEVWASDINDLGQVVGQAIIGGDWNGQKAISWETSPSMQLPVVLETQLDAVSGSGWTALESARAINDLGQIGGWGKGPSGNREFFLLTPFTPMATISTNPTSLTFEVPAGGPTLTPIQDLAISNIGLGEMNWTITSSATWLMIGPSSGSGDGIVGVFADANGLLPGTYSGNLTITSQEATNSPLTVGVTLTVTQPVMAVSPFSMSFIAPAGGPTVTPTQNLAISNTGTGAMTWTVTPDAPWLKVAPSSGSGNGNAGVFADITGLSAGIYHGTLTITSPEASNSPLPVVVTLTITGLTATISTNPTSLTFEAPAVGPFLTPIQNLAISNIGTGAMNWTITSSANWLEFGPPSGSGNAIVGVFADISGLSPGTYSGNLMITSPEATNSPLSVAVTLTITQPTIAVSPASMSFNGVEGGSDPAAQSLAISNTGTGTMSWSVTSSAAWLAASPTSGTNNGSVTVTVTTAGLAAGNYSGTITIAAPGSANTPLTVPVTLNLLAPVTFTAPTANEILHYRTRNYPIAWQLNRSFPTLSKMDLYYTTDASANPVKWTLIKAGLSASTRSYPWNVPALKNPSTKCQTKVVLKNSSGSILSTGLSSLFTIAP